MGPIDECAEVIYVETKEELKMMTDDLWYKSHDFHTVSSAEKLFLAELMASTDSIMEKEERSDRRSFLFLRDSACPVCGF